MVGSRIQIPTGSQTLARGRDPETRGNNESDPEGVADELDDGRDHIPFAKCLCAYLNDWGRIPQ